LTMAKLLVSVKRALESADDSELESNQSNLVEAPIGASLLMQALRDQARKIAAHDNVVFIKGEAGVGKNTYANYIHSLSSRKAKRFTFLNEDNFNRAEAAQQLFGTEENEIVTPGIFETSKSGTIFINDVAKINSKGQKLLSQLLKKKQFRRTGGSKSLKFDARIIVATQHDLKAEVHAERFDDELYFLLNVVAVQIPALREHLQDIPELLRYYIDYYCSKDNFPYKSFTIAAQNRLLHYQWPGNINELKNLVQRLLILSSDDEISAEEIEVALDDQNLNSKTKTGSQEQLFNLPLREARESFEKSYFQYQLKQVGGNISKLSERVGLERTHLYRKLRALGINTKEPQ
ncbi:MAG: sigma 54-interacting transcriptional regulator, partial [Pseudomonadota bacterium]